MDLSMRWTNIQTAGIWVSMGLLALAGCSTAHKAKDQNWMDLFSPATLQPAATSCAGYGIERIERDYDTLAALTHEMDGLANEMAIMKRTLLFKEHPYLDQQENWQIEFLLFRFMNARDALLDIVDCYRQGTAADPATHAKGAVLGMSAGMQLNYYSSHFAALFHGEKALVKLINTARPSYEIPAGFYNAIYDSVTSIEHLELIDVTWYLFCKELADPASELFALRESDPAYRPLITQMDGLHASAHIQVEYLLHANWSSMPELHNRLHHSRIAGLGDELGDQIGGGLYKTRGFVFKNVARIKDPTAHTLRFSSEQVQQIKALLQPGDILLTYTAGYMSNVFLPGEFKHGITYIGTVEDRRTAGLTDAVLAQRAVSDRQSQMLIEHVGKAELADGSPVNIVEAVAEGVILNSLDKLLATHINRMAVIRPRLTEQERLDQLVSLFQYAGTPYDFKFDFQDDAYQCCTELVYRTINKKGSVDFSLIKMKGVWILAADDILRYYLAQNPAAFDFILLADRSSDPKDRKAEIQLGDEGLQALYDLMGVPEA